MTWKPGDKQREFNPKIVFTQKHKDLVLRFIEDNRKWLKTGDGGCLIGTDSSVCPLGPTLGGICDEFDMTDKQYKRKYLTVLRRRVSRMEVS